MQLGISQSQHSLVAVPKQPVEWAYGPLMAKRMFTTYKIV